MAFTNKSKNIVIAYFCFLAAVLMLSGIIFVPGIFGKIIAVLMAAVWYKAGVGILKYKNVARIIAIILFVIVFLSGVASVYSSIILPLLNSSITGVGIGRWVSLFLTLFSATAIFVCLAIMLKIVLSINTLTSKSCRLQKAQAGTASLTLRSPIFKR